MKVKKTKWRLTIGDGFCEWEYEIKIPGDESCWTIYKKICKLFHSRVDTGFLRTIPNEYKNFIGAKRPKGGKR